MNLHQRPHSAFRLLAPLAVAGLLSAAAPTPGFAWADVFSLPSGIAKFITHQVGYNGTQTTLTNTVCAAKGPQRKALKKVLKRVVKTWNRRKVVTGNLLFGSANNIPFNAFDMESFLIHEVGHCIHLAHPNAANESGLSDPERNYTKAGAGSNGVLNLNRGRDKTIGSCDDKRGDDVNVHWFKIADNDPFTLPKSKIVDKTTYSVMKSDLPKKNCVKKRKKHLFAANGDRAVSTKLGYAPTESVMQQGQFNDEDQRRLTADDVAGIAYSETGFDEKAGTADDYKLVLKFTAKKKCDIPARIDNSLGPGVLGFCSQGASQLTATHGVSRSPSISIGPSINWFFNN